jgi:dTDP-glucose pyrophosphorylase
MSSSFVGVVLAAGNGRRISDLPLTKVLPKCMLPILDRPILHYVLDNLCSLGVRDIIIVVGSSGTIIEKYFGNGTDFGVRIRYFHQARPQGIAHAVGLLEQSISNSFFVALGDDLTVASNLSEMKSLFYSSRACAVEALVRENDVQTLRRTCCVKMDLDGRITDLIEKPRHPFSTLRGCGFYLFNQRIFDYIRKTKKSRVRNEKEITDTLRLVAHDGLVYGLKVVGLA